MVSAITTKVDSVTNSLALTQDDVGRLIGASPRAVSRWKSGESTPHRSTRKRLFELAYVAERLSRVLKPDHANAWMFSRNPLLAGEAPATLIERGEFEKVLALIEALADGVVV